eukprot:2127851-Amphidinium_carterae.1
MTACITSSWDSKRSRRDVIKITSSTSSHQSAPASASLLMKHAIDSAMPISEKSCALFGNISDWHIHHTMRSPLMVVVGLMRASCAFHADILPRWVKLQDRGNWKPIGLAPCGG